MNMVRWDICEQEICGSILRARLEGVVGKDNHAAPEVCDASWGKTSDVMREGPLIFIRGQRDGQICGRVCENMGV